MKSQLKWDLAPSLDYIGQVHADFSQELQQIWNRSRERLFACRLSLSRVGSVLFSPHFVL